MTTTEEFLAKVEKLPDAVQLFFKAIALTKLVQSNMQKLPTAQRKELSDLDTTLFSKQYGMLQDAHTLENIELFVKLLKMLEEAKISDAATVIDLIKETLLRLYNSRIERLQKEDMYIHNIITDHDNLFDPAKLTKEQ